MIPTVSLSGRTTHPTKYGINYRRRGMHQQTNPIRLLQGEDRLRERKNRNEEKPFKGRRQHCPRKCEDCDCCRREPRRPSSEKSEEYQRPGKIRPLMESDADRDARPRWLALKGPITRRNCCNGHPVDSCITAYPRCGELTDQCLVSAANQAQDRGGAPGPHIHCGRPGAGVGS